MLLTFDTGSDAWTSADGAVQLSYEAREAGSEDSNGIFPSPSPTLCWSQQNLLFWKLPVPPPAAAAGSASMPLPPDTWGLPRCESSQGAESSLMDPAASDAQRQALSRQYPDRSAEFLREMTADLKPGTPEDYRRIPLIWNITIAAARRGEAGEIRKLLDISLPKPGEPLHDWQSVVLGGGLINGISMAGPWPGARLVEIIGQDQALLDRWNRSLDLAALMANSEKVPHGTRYGALRMIALLPWEKSRTQLKRYLARDQNGELQQGAVSGLADINHPEAGRLLVEGFDGLTGSSKNFALDALLRTPERIDLLLETVAARKLTRLDLGDERTEKLLSHGDADRREKSRALLSPP